MKDSDEAMFYTEDSVLQASKLSSSSKRSRGAIAAGISKLGAVLPKKKIDLEGSRSPNLNKKIVSGVVPPMLEASNSCETSFRGEPVELDLDLDVDSPQKTINRRKVDLSILTPTDNAVIRTKKHDTPVQKSSPFANFSNKPHPNHKRRTSGGF